MWLEPLTVEDHLQDFHEINSDEKGSLWSTQRPTNSLEDSREKLLNIYAENPQKSWLLATYAVMSSEYPAPAPGCESATTPTTRTTTTTTAPTTAKMIGMVRTTRPSPWGLMIGYKLRSDCWGKGYATRAVKMFLDEYWREPRRAPRDEVYTAVPEPETKVVSGWEGKPAEEEAQGDGANEIIDITHLIAQVDLENAGSMRVAEKCGGKMVAVSEKGVKVWRFEEKRGTAVWRLDKPGVEPSLT